MFETAAVARCHPSESVCGDGWCIQVHEGARRLTVVDGAGHGQHAADATALVQSLLEQNPHWPGPEALQRCHVALRGTRGAVMSVAVFGADLSTLTVTGVGNVESYLWMDGEERHLVTQRGLLGANIPAPRPLELQLSGEWVFVMHSDGIRPRFSLRNCELLSLATSDPAALAAVLLRDYSRTDDDATVVVTRGRSP